MKKLLLVLAIGMFAACTDSSTESESTSDTASMSAPADTSMMTPAPMDSTAMPADTSSMKTDSAATK